MQKQFRIPKFQLPGFVARIGRRLPQWPHAIGLMSLLNAAVKLKVLPEESLVQLEGKTFLVDVLDTGSQAVIEFEKGLFRPVLTPRTRQAPADLSFRANLSTFLQMASRQEDPDTLFFNRELAIEGDTELGLLVKNMLDAVELPDVPRLPALPKLRLGKTRT